MTERRPVTDDELLAALSTSLAPEPMAPPADGLIALRRALAGTPGRSGNRWLQWRRPLVAVGVSAGVLLGGAGAAFAAGVAPEPLRAAAYDIGLPVDSPALSTARHEEAQLRRDLASAATSADTAAAARSFAAQLSRLSRSDQQKLGTSALTLLKTADRQESVHHLPVTPIPGTYLPKPAGGHRGGPTSSVSTTTEPGSRYSGPPPTDHPAPPAHPRHGGPVGTIPPGSGYPPPGHTSPTTSPGQSPYGTGDGFGNGGASVSRSYGRPTDSVAPSGS